MLKSLCAEKVFKQNNCLRFAETFPTVVFICRKNSCSKICVKKKFIERIVVWSLQKHILQWYLLAKKFMLKSFCAEKKVLKRIVVCSLWKHFLQWYLFADKIQVEKFVRKKKFLNRKLLAVCGNIFYSGIYLRKKFMLKNLCDEKSF